MRKEKTWQYLWQSSSGPSVVHSPRFEALQVWSLKGPSSVTSERFIKKTLPIGGGDEIPTVKHGENGKTKRHT